MLVKRIYGCSKYHIKTGENIEPPILLIRKKLLGLLADFRLTLQRLKINPHFPAPPLLPQSPFIKDGGERPRRVVVNVAGEARKFSQPLDVILKKILVVRPTK